MRRIFKILILFLSILFISNVLVYSQTENFKQLTKKTLQSYSDRGYILVQHTSGEISLSEPLVTPKVDLYYNTYYVVLVQLDGCLYCSYQLFFVDEENNLIPVDYDEFVEDGLKQTIYKFTCDSNKVGKFVVLLDSDLAYHGNIYIFKK